MLSAQTFGTASLPVVPPVIVPQAGDTLDMLLAKALHFQAGGSGSELVSNTVARVYPVMYFVVITAATFSAVTPSAGYTATGLTGAAFPVGAVLPFRLDGFTLTSGSVLAIKA